MKRFLKLSLVSLSTFSAAGTIVGCDNNFNKPKLPPTKNKTTNFEKQISDLKKQIGDFTSEKTKLATDLEQKNIAIANLKQQITTLNSKQNSLSNELEQKNIVITDLVSKNADLTRAESGLKYFK